MSYCLLHRKNDCDRCTIPVTDNKQLIARLEHLITIGEFNSRHKADGEEKDKILKEINDYKIWLESLDRNI